MSFDIFYSLHFLCVLFLFHMVLDPVNLLDVLDSVIYCSLRGFVLVCFCCYSLLRFYLYFSCLFLLNVFFCCCSCCLFVAIFLLAILFDVIRYILFTVICCCFFCFHYFRCCCFLMDLLVAHREVQFWSWSHLYCHFFIDKKKQWQLNFLVYPQNEKFHMW